MAVGWSCSVRHLLVAACALLALATLADHVDARYLPTRGQDDRLDRLRELLKDLLEGEMERGVNPQAEKRFFFKREVQAADVPDAALLGVPQQQQQQQRHLQHPQPAH